MSDTSSAPQSTFSAPAEAPKLGKTSRSAEREEARKGKNPLNWSIYTVSELVRFRDEITATLPPLSLSKLSLEEETLLQYHTLREMQNEVLAEEEVPANQKAQVANSVGAVLKSLGDMQVNLYSSERFKAVENLMIRTLTKLEESVADQFLTEYAKILRKYDQNRA